MGHPAFTSRTKNPDFQGVFDISPEDLADYVAKHSAAAVAMVDVREVSEFTGELGHILGAELIVLGSLSDHIDALPKEKPVVFICKSGGRSARASAFAQANGFDQVYNLKGGMMLWNSLKLPVERS